MKAAEKIIQAALDLGINSLTMWGSSVANVTERSPAEVKFLYKLFELYFRKLAGRKELKDKGVRIRVLGRWQELFPKSLQQAIQAVVKATEKHDRHNFTLLMAYDGRDEMLAAVKNIVRKSKGSGKLDRETLKKNLWTKDLPPVDLVIRTGGEPHWSAGLLMWDVAEARLYFTEILWPAFSPKEFKKALDYYAKSERRYGK